MATPRKKPVRRNFPLLAVLAAVLVIGILLVCLLPKGGKQARMDTNKQMQDYILQQCDEWDDIVTVTITHDIQQNKERGQVTYDASIYQVSDGVPVTDALWQLKPNAAERHEALTQIGIATITLDSTTGDVVNFQNEPVYP